jgi:hypothetical protein
MKGINVPSVQRTHELAALVDEGPKLTFVARQDALASMPAFLRYGALFTQSTQAQSVLLLVSDFSITAAIVAGLWKSRTGFKRTDSLVMRLVIAITESMIAPLILGVAYVVSTPTLSLSVTYQPGVRCSRQRPKLMVCFLLMRLGVC